MFNNQKQFHHDSLYAYNVNNSHSLTVWSTQDITPSKQG
jgi:hypothetical protein